MLADHLRDAFDAMPDAVFVADPASQRITYANVAARALTGQDLHALTALTLCDLHPTAIHQQMRRHLVRVNSGNGTVNFQADLQPPGSHPIAAAIALRRAQIGGASYIISTARDIRSERQAQEVLRSSEALYRMLIEATSDLVFRLSRDGTYLDFRVLPDSGLPIPAPEAIIGRTLAEVVPPHVADIALPAIQRTVDTGTKQTIEYSIREPDRTHHYEARFVPGAGGDVVAIVRDITERKQKAEALQKSEETARALLNASADAALFTDRNWTVSAANETMLQRLGLRIEDMLGKNIFSLLPAEVAETRRAYGEIMLQTQQPISFEDERAGRSISNRVHPIFDEQGKVRYIAVFTRDNTEQKRADALLERQRNLLNSVAKAASLLLAPGDLDAAVNEVLALVGQIAAADAVSIYVNHPHPVTGEPAISPRYYWLNDGIQDKSLDPRLVNAVWTPERMVEYSSVLSQNQVLQATRDNLPAEEQVLLDAMGIRALLLVPIFVGAEFWGVMIFSDLVTERRWSAEEINALQTLAASLGSAVQHQRFEIELRQKRDFADRLRHFGNRISGIFNPDQILQWLLEELRQVIAYDAASGMLVDGAESRVVASAGYDRFGMSRHQLMRQSYSIERMPLLRRISDSRTPMILEDVRSEPRWINVPGGEWIRGWLGAPIVVGGKVRGYITLDSARPGSFSGQDTHWVESLVGQAAVALENAWYVADIQRLEQVKSEMIRIASHDLRSPLARAQLLVQRLADELDQALSPDQRRSLEQTLTATQDMERIITEILSLERIETQHRTAQPVYWCELIDQASKAVQDDLKQAGQTLIVDCPPSLPITRGSPLKLERAVFNLIHNAAKYSPPGGVIRVRAFEKSYGPERVLAVEVTDTGIGIPPDRLPELFQPFRRVEQSQTAEVNGLGLGLALVKSIVQEHHGRVYVDSVPGQGSMFGFWVPIPEDQ